MHRRNLIIRRFGALDFGIGYYEDGVWVDHAASGAGRGPASLDAVHEWLACCDTTTAGPIVIGEAVPGEQRLRVAVR
ncbi:MAG: hypothetical protein ACRDFY_04010 [Candidatus Limnocylindria bacterium]